MVGKHKFDKSATPTAQADSPEPETEQPPKRPQVSLGDRAARGIGVTLTVQFGRALLQFGSVVVLARLLTPSDFGLVAMVTAVIGVAQLIRDFGLSLAAVRAPTLSREERDNLFWANFLMGLGCTIVIIVATPLIVAIYGQPRLTPIVLSLSIVFTFSGITTQYRANLSRELRFKALGLSDIIAQAVAVGVAIAMAAMGYGLWALVAQQIVSAVGTAALCVYWGRWIPRLPHRRVSIRPFMSFGVGVFGTHIVDYFTKNVDNIAIGAVWGATPLGLYSRGYQLMMMPLNQINAPMTQVALPVLSRVQHDEAAFMAYLRKSQLVACYVTATLFAVAIGLSDPVVRVLFGERWLGVVPIFAVLGVAGLFRSVSQVAYWAYLAKGESGALFAQRLVTGALTIACILAGLPWGPVGVAAGCAVSSFVSWVVAVLHVGRVIHLDTWPLLWNASRILIVIGVPAGLLAFLGTVLVAGPVLQILTGIGLVLLYLGCTFLVVPSVRADLVVTISFARRAVARR
jgi:polysaccharide transporter, PST family